MSKANNLTDFLTDVANAIRTKKGTNATIDPQDFSTEIANLPSGGGKLVDLVEKTLTEITADDLTGCTTIGTSAFSAQYQLKSATLPNTVTTIGSSSFANCRHITEMVIPDSVTTIDFSAFQGVSNLVKVTLGSGVTTINSAAFSSDTKLIEVYNKSALSLTTGSTSNGYVSYYALNIYTPSSGSSKISTDSNGFIFYIDGSTKYLMGYKGDATSITLPTTAPEVYKMCFAYKTDITNITIPSGINILGANAFTGSGIRSITIPSSVSVIPQYMCSACTNLSNVTLPSSITTINNYAFTSCSNLSIVMINRTTPPTLTNSNAFPSITQNYTIYVPSASVSTYKSASNWSSLSSKIQGM